MALTYNSTSLRNEMVTVIGNVLNGGNIQIKSSDDQTLCTLNFSDPAFGSPAGGVITANSIADGNVVATGTIASAEFYDSNSQLQFTSTAGVGGDISFNKSTLTQGDIVRVSSMTYAAPS
ncbi:MAG: hypothetical protein N0E48_15965 [Candidatus Thiodiazotropha endolucinida]|nr:hypothetical protein [Candidatus Thiodiazotropha taylori]MCW4344827.1 hypothetical protein [Candidatus Thiodiazotropha endolucinida]